MHRALVPVVRHRSVVTCAHRRSSSVLTPSARIGIATGPSRGSALEQRVTRIVSHSYQHFSSATPSTPSGGKTAISDAAADASGAAAIAAAREASRNSLAAGDSGSAHTPSNMAVLKQLLSYLWPANEPDLRARVVASVALLLGAKVCAVYVPFMFKNAVDMLNAGIDAGNVASALPIAALIGCKKREQVEHVDDRESQILRC